MQGQEIKNESDDDQFKKPVHIFDEFLSGFIVSRDPFHFKANERDRANELSHNTNQNLKAHKNEAKYVAGFGKFKIIKLC